MFKYYKEGRLCIGVAKVESLDKKIIGNRCPVFYFTGGGFNIDEYKKEVLKEFSRLRNITSSSKSHWVETRKPDKIWNCESVSKLKGIGGKGEK